MRNATLLFLLLLATLTLQAQGVRLQGRVTNSRQEPLSFVSLQVRELRSGVVTAADGSYELLLNAGTSHIFISRVGYKSQTLVLKLQTDSVQNLVLEDDVSQNLSEVVVRAKAKDRAEEVMRRLIEQKDRIGAAAGPYSCRVYIKAIQQDGTPVNKKMFEPKDGRLRPDDPELQGLAMAEIALQLDAESESRIREERLGVQKSGNPQNLFYLSATEGSFNFYNNLVKVPSISPTPFLSPVSQTGLLAYKFKTIKTKRVGKYRIYTISVKPRALTNATVEGELTVSDSSWAILHTRFRFPEYHLQEYDFFEVEQDYSFVQDTAWMITRQQFTYASNGSRKKLSGRTTVSYTDYKLHQNFSHRHFGSEVSSTAQTAYEQGFSFWDSVRTEPLTDREQRLFRFEDSLRLVRNSDQYLDSIEHLINKITWKKLGFFGQSFWHRKKERYWHLPPVVSLYQPFAFGGGRLSVSLGYSKTFTSRKNLSVNSNLSYGLRNNDVNGSIRLHRMYNPFNRGYYDVSAGRDFQFIYEGDAWINMIKRNNVYLNNYLGAGHGLELANGFFISNELEIAFRRSVANYKTGDLVDSVLGNILDNNQAVPFKPYNALYGSVKLQYTPAQRYRREPREKIILGSKWPTVYVLWRKGIPNLVGSEVDFDYGEAGLEQHLNLGLLGLAKYTVKTGSFFNSTDLRLIDYQFQRRGDPLMFMNPHRAFQALDSTFPVFKRFYEGHYVHEFNGLFLNKIPLLKKLQLREMGGAGFLIAPERNLRYAELFVGVERAFESPFNPLDKFKLGVYLVGSVANKFQNPIQLKIGFTTWDKRRNRWF